MEGNNYTTDSLTQEQAFQKADIVLIGRITHLGISEPEGPGQAYFQGTKIEILNVEKGNFVEPEAAINYQVWSIKNRQIVAKPEAGKQYKFYVSVLQNGKTLKAIKISDV